MRASAATWVVPALPQEWYKGERTVFMITSVNTQQVPSRGSAVSNAELVATGDSD